MRIGAIILLIVFSAFSSEQILLPSQCPLQQKMANVSGCHKRCHMGVCPMKNSPGEKKGRHAAFCIDCPLTAAMIQQHIASLQPVMVAVERHFSPLIAPALSDYTDQQLKPPNDVHAS